MIGAKFAANRRRGGLRVVAPHRFGYRPGLLKP